MCGTSRSNYIDIYSRMQIEELIAQFSPDDDLCGA